MAQVGVSFAVPVIVVIFYVLPRGPGSIKYLCPFMCLFGMSTGTIVPGVIRPLISQIAPKSQIASMIAWEFSLEQFFGSLWGPLLVTWLSSISGYVQLDIPVAAQYGSLGVCHPHLCSDRIHLRFLGLHSHALD